MATAPAIVKVAPVERDDDIAQAWDCAAAAFGRQTSDAIWIAASPGWDTPEGRSRAVQRLSDRWRSATTDRDGRPNTVVLKATLPADDDDDDSGAERIVGIAIWCQLSVAEGRGDAPATDDQHLKTGRELYPDDEAGARFIGQVFGSLCRQRNALVGSRPSEAALALDLCAVDPSFQGRGAAKALVRWGLDEAERRGGLEIVLEASSMGRRVYEGMGFRREGPEIAYRLDEEFADRVLPSNIFMRTRPDAIGGAPGE